MNHLLSPLFMYMYLLSLTFLLLSVNVADAGPIFGRLFPGEGQPGNLESRIAELTTINFDEALEMSKDQHWIGNISLYTCIHVYIYIYVYIYPSMYVYLYNTHMHTYSYNI